MDTERTGGGPPSKEPRKTARFASDRLEDPPQAPAPPPAPIRPPSPPAGDVPGGAPDEGGEPKNPIPAQPTPQDSGSGPGSGREDGGTGGQKGSGVSVQEMIDFMLDASSRMESTAIYLRVLVDLLSMSPTQLQQAIGAGGGNRPDVNVGSLARLLLLRRGSKADISSLLALARSPAFEALTAQILDDPGQPPESPAQDKRDQT